MQNLNFLETELLDIVFRGKNKNYGAYVLRKEYPARARRALAYTVLGILLIYGVQFVVPKPSLPDIIDVPTFDGGEITLLDDVVLVSTQPPGGAPILESIIKQKMPLEVVKTTAVPTPIVDQETPTDPNPVVNTTGPTTTNSDVAGKGGTGADPVSNTPSGPTGPSGPTTTAAVVPPIPDPTPVNIAQFEPEFPGGENAMLAYLKSKIRYPKMAIDIEHQGMVYVQFVVNTRGNISNIEVLKGIGMGCDKEAIRVIKTMPVWKPASNGRHKVNFSMVLPIQFEL